MSEPGKPMNVDAAAKRICLRQEAYNTCHVALFGLIFKLSYASVDNEKPRLEIFLDDDEAKSREWKIYGTMLDDSDDRFARVDFEIIGEEKQFIVCSSRYRIVFDNFYREIHNYPGGSKERRYVYEFLVKALP